MADTLPKFDAPPVIETLLSVQFDPIPNFTSAFAGWFWKSYLDPNSKDWTKVIEVGKIGDQFERFEQSGLPMASIQFAMGVGAQRTQFVRTDETRMVQVQDSRFVLNWKRMPDGNYPSYGALLPEFKSIFNLFCRFVHDAGLPPLKLNQWEMAYINMIPKGELWKSQSDLDQIFVDALIPRVSGCIADNEFVNAAWRFVLPENRGRLHVTLANGIAPPKNEEHLRLQLITRGSIRADDWELDKYYDLGHETIVQAFVAMTTPQAQKYWKRTQ